METINDLCQCGHSFHQHGRMDEDAFNGHYRNGHCHPTHCHHGDCRNCYCQRYVHKTVDLGLAALTIVVGLLLVFVFLQSAPGVAIFIALAALVILYFLFQ